MSNEETFAYLTFPIIPPEKLLGDFLKSKLEFEALKKYPQWDIPRPDPVIKLVAAKRELHKTELKLVEKKKEAKEQRKKLDVQWLELDEDAVKLKQTFHEFDKMIKENFQKRERAIRKNEKQQALQAERDALIKEMQPEYDKLIKIRDKMDYQIKEHKLYEDYLQTIVDAHPEYKTPNDVFNKFGALDEARNALTQKLEENLKTLENIKSEMLRLSNVHNSIHLGLDNKVTELHKRYAKAKADAERWEQIVKGIQVRCGERYIETLNVRKACWELYLEMCKHRKVKPQIKQSNFEDQLFYIKKNMLKLKRTIEICQQKTAKEFSSLQVESPDSKRR